MLKYRDYAICFSEFPDEISLCVNISGCPCECDGCHSKYLWKDIGVELDESALDSLIQSHPDITCFGFMGGDADQNGVVRLASYIKKKYKYLKVGMYSGRDFINGDLYLLLDYYKIGHYDSKLGGLNCAGTNQRMYKNGFEDITYKFQK